jgi:predicted acetyltransferase
LTNIEVLPAAEEQRPVVANLLELYAHDFSEFHDLELGEDGRFGYKDLSLYWREASRYPFLFRIDGRLAGLALIKKGSEVPADENVWDIAEFFVVRRYRRRGVGTSIAHQLWRRFPGPWNVRVMQSNSSARQFWEHAIKTFSRFYLRLIALAKAAKSETSRPILFCDNGERQHIRASE